MKKVILILFLLATAYYSGFAIADELPNEAGLKDLTSIEILKQDFNVHQNKIRIVTLLSPT